MTSTNAKWNFAVESNQELLKLDTILSNPILKSLVVKLTHPADDKFKLTSFKIRSKEIQFSTIKCKIIISI